MERYRTGKTLYVELAGDETTEGEWWFDQTIAKVIRYNSDTNSVCIAERESAAPTIRTWMSPVTFEDEQRLCNEWKLIHKCEGDTTHDTIVLPVNNRRYTLRERVRHTL